MNLGLTLTTVLSLMLTFAGSVTVAEKKTTEPQQQLETIDAIQRS